ncbi:MAG: DUF2179 domain-containing protein [Tangfeifania sp.]
MVILETFYDSSLFTYVVLPLLIFMARITDVTIGTIRIVMISKGAKRWAPFLGFVEIFIWLLAMTKIFENLDNWICYFAYAGGFAAGNYIGLIIEEKLAVGIVKIQIITRKNADKLIENLKEAGYGITYHSAQGSNDFVSIIYSIIKRHEIRKVEKIIKKTNPQAFYSVEDVKTVSHTVYPIKPAARRWRKGK